MNHMQHIAEMYAHAVLPPGNALCTQNKELNLCDRVGAASCLVRVDLAACGWPCFQCDEPAGDRVQVLTGSGCDLVVLDLMPNRQSRGDAFI